MSEDKKKDLRELAKDAKKTDKGKEKSSPPPTPEAKGKKED